MFCIIIIRRGEVIKRYIMKTLEVSILSTPSPRGRKNKGIKNGEISLIII